MHKIFTVCIIVLSFASACEFKAEIKTPDGKNATSKIRNGIILKETSLKVSQAFLIYDDDRTLVPESNEVKVGRKVLLRLIIDTGFTNIGDKAFPGASENVKTSDGGVLLDEKDLFASYQDGVPKKDVGIISLFVEITNVDKLYDYYLVSFRVWDKKGTASVSGSYKLYIK